MREFKSGGRCTKCGCYDVDTKYCRPGRRRMFGMEQCTEIREHLHKKCKRCGYIWEELPLDHEEKEG